MNKSGRVPVLIFGVEIISEDVKDDKANPEVDSKQKRSEKQQHFQQHLDQQQQHPIRPYVGTPFPISWQLVQQEVSSAVDAASIFANQYSNSCKRQWRGMESLYVRISTDLPSKLQRSAQRLATSAQKRWKTLTRTVLEFVLGTPSK